MIRDARKSKITKRRKASTVNNKRYLLIVSALYLGIAVTGLYVAAGSQDMRALFQEMSDNQKYRDSLLAEHSRLLLERGTHSTYQNVDRVAEEQLNMKFPERPEGVAN